MLDALERLEVSFRTEVALSLGRRNPKAHRDLSFLGRDFEGPADFKRPVDKGGATKHQVWLQRLDNRARDSKDKFADHFRKKHPNDDMPIWMAVELLDFGPLSHLISGLKNKDLAIIGSHYGGVNPQLMKSWARSMAFTRNVCAHHSRLWNKPLVNQPALSGKSIPQELQHLQAHPSSVQRLYSIACIARFMLKFANPRTSWKDRFVAHINTFPATDQIKLSAAGFPNDWQNEQLWR
jgi:abortive infection bacteriophage resistance protein